MNFYSCAMYVCMYLSAPETGANDDGQLVKIDPRAMLGTVQVSILTRWHSQHIHSKEGQSKGYEKKCAPHQLLLEISKLIN